MKIFIVGGAGYIGSTLVPQLLKYGHEVIVLDNFMYHQTSLLNCCYDEKLIIINGDSRNKALVAEHVKTVDAILPLACLTGAPLCSKDPSGAKSTNFDAITMLLELRNKNQWIIFPTTNSGYGVGEKDIHCTEETPLRPVSLYGKLKVEVEKILLSSENTITLRFATVFGISPRMRLDLLVNDFTYRALNDRYLVLFEASFKRNYLHIRDATSAFIFCLFGNSEAVHHAIFVSAPHGSLDDLDAADDGYGYECFGGFGTNNISDLLGGYAPGTIVSEFPTGLAQHIPANSDLVVQIHYAPLSTDQIDLSSINVFFLFILGSKYLIFFIIKII